MKPLADLHCHPSLKPYGQSFKNTPGENSLQRKQRNSIWYYDSPRFFDKVIQMLAGLAKFTQADCSTLMYGNARIICASLYPIEKGFFYNDLGKGDLSDLANNFVTCVGKPRVQYIQGNKNYFEDLCREYKYYEACSGKPVNTESGQFRYRLVKNYAEIDQLMANEAEAANTIFIIMTIEGMHSLIEDYDEKIAPDENKVLINVDKMKGWTYPPFFVTLAHHFNNHLCGHAKSLFDIIGGVSDQATGLNEPMKPLGEKVIKSLLSTNNGRRILIDVKHMSTAARYQYYDMLEKDYAGQDIPIVISHGAPNGQKSPKDTSYGSQYTSPKLFDHDINFYDDELLKMAKSKGIIGLQLDERRLANKATMQDIQHSTSLNKIRHYRSELLWNNVKHIVKLLDRNDMFAWDNIAIGSDFDGIINPLNGFLTAEALPNLQEYLERHIYNYLKDVDDTKLKPYNRITSSEAVDRIFSGNAGSFLRRCF